MKQRHGVNEPGKRIVDGSVSGAAFLRMVSRDASKMLLGGTQSMFVALVVNVRNSVASCCLFESGAVLVNSYTGCQADKQTLCRSKISFAMLAGGPVSRKGLPTIVREMGRIR